MKVVGIVALICVVSVALAGCGGGGGTTSNSGAGPYTYVALVPVNSTFPGTSGLKIYMTIVSPVEIPQSLLTQKDVKLVDQPEGPQKCSVTKTAPNSSGPAAVLSGKRVTIKINSTNPIADLLCMGLKTQPLRLDKLGGG